jgi:hypothetical protein
MINTCQEKQLTNPMTPLTVVMSTQTRKQRILAILSGNALTHRYARTVKTDDVSRCHSTSSRQSLHVRTTSTELEDCCDVELPVGLYDGSKGDKGQLTSGCNATIVIKQAIMDVQEERKEIIELIENNYKFAKEKYLAIDHEGSRQANLISAILSMKRIKALEKKIGLLKISYIDLKVLLKHVNTCRAECHLIPSMDCIRRKIQLIHDQREQDIELNRQQSLTQSKEQTKQEQLVRSRESDDELISELSRKIFKEQLVDVRKGNLGDREQTSIPKDIAF